MKSTASALLLTLSALAALAVTPACGMPGEAGSAGTTTAADPNGAIELDSGMTSDERTRLVSDLTAMQTWNVDGAGGKYFAQTFGGDTSADVWRYVDERVNFVLPRGTKIEQRVHISGGNFDPNELAQPDLPGVLAQNIGTSLWLLQEMIRPSRVQVEINGRLVEADSTRVGILLLGNDYTGQLPDVMRVATIVHEARHSDCTGGITRSQLKELGRGGEVPETQCGHLHIDCPPGHDLAGLPACDNGPWGAYAIEAIYAVSLTSCAGCTRAQRAAAQAVAVDAVSRIVNFDQLTTGAYGPPDMSSNGITR